MRVDVRNLSCSLGGKEILRGVSFSVESGGFAGILGPNGSGKTTLLRCMSGVAPVSGGVALLGGTPVTGLSRRETARLVAFVPQASPGDFDFTVREIVSMGRTPHIGRWGLETRRDEEIVQAAMGLAGIGGLSERAFGSLSGGEMQRAIIARALAQEPEILLLDEPTAHLDLGTQYGMMELISSLNRDRRMTVVAVLHDLNLAAQYCRQVVVLKSGKVAAAGKPAGALTPETIKGAFGIDVLVKRHPLTGTAAVTPYYLKPGALAPNGKTVHLVCGGGSGAPVMKLLREAGYTVTAGVLNPLDTDYEVATALGIKFPPDIPFSQISDGADVENRRLIGLADAVVVADFPVGRGNLRNVAAVESASRPIVVLVESEKTERRDFTGGEFSALFARLLERSVTARDGEGAVAALSRLFGSDGKVSGEGKR